MRTLGGRRAAVVAGFKFRFSPEEGGKGQRRTYLPRGNSAVRLTFVSFRAGGLEKDIKTRRGGGGAWIVSLCLGEGKKKVKGLNWIQGNTQKGFR